MHLRHWTQRLKLLESDDAFEQLVQKLETVYIAKNYAEASQIILEMSSLQLNEANAEFVCTYLIRDFIRDEDAISSFDERLDFHLSSLMFIENNIHQLSNINNLVVTMKSIIFIRCRYSDKDKLLVLFDKVIELAKSDNRLLSIELTALAVKSEFVDKDYKETLLREVISRCPNVTHDKTFAFLKYRSLCELGVTIHSSESISLINDAEQILSLLEEDVSSYYISLKKSELLMYIQDSDTKERWIKDIFSILTNAPESIYLDKYIEIASYLCYIETDYIKRFSDEFDIEKTLIEFARQYSADSTKCHSLLYYSQCCQLICSISDDQDIINEFCQYVFDISSSFPHECNGFLRSLFIVSHIYMLLPENIANTPTKSSVLQRIKENEYTNSIYFDILEFVYDRSIISDNSVFGNDIKYIDEQRKKLNWGYQLYCEGKKQEAEQIFTDLTDCKISNIKDSAQTNLGFMVRRNEATSKFDFIKIMQQKKVLTGFDFMNLLLFYSAKNQFENAEYQNAKHQIELITEEEKNSIVDWWSKIDIVGKEESRLALSFLGY